MSSEPADEQLVIVSRHLRMRLAVVLIAMLTVTTAFFVTAAPVRAALPPSIALPPNLPDYMRYIIVNNYKFDPLVQSPTIPDSLKYTNLEVNQQAYFLVQFNGPVTPSMKAGLASTGAVVLSYINYNAFIVRADQSTMSRVQSLSTVRWTGVFEPAYKLSPTLSDSYAQMAEKTMQNELNGGPLAGVVTMLGSGSTPAKSIAVDAMGRPTSASVSNRASGVGTTAMAAAGGASLGATADGGSVSAATESALATYSSTRITVTVLTFEKAWVPAATQAVRMLGGTNILFNFNLGGWGTIQATIDKNALPSLAHLPGVMWIDRNFQPYVFNDIARWVIQSGNSTTFATPVHNHGIHGTNQTVTLADTGIDFKHPDFWDPNNTTPGPTARKLTAYYDPPCPPGGCDLTDNGINHGTHTSGSLAGDDGKWHVYDGDPTGSNGTTGPHDGQAFDAKINMQDTSSDGQFIYFNNINDLWSLAVNHSSWIHSDSWGSCCSSYIADSATTDAFVWNNVNFTIVFAAGNAGSGLSTMNPYAGSKNVIAAGATSNGVGEDSVASFSSRGPMQDGRLKPDVMAPGVGLWSAKGACPSPCGGTTYWQLSGTSMATPTTAGAATLTRQYYMDGWYPTGAAVPANGFTPSAALIKATLINSAVEMTGAGAYDNGQNFYPNDNQGWGRTLLDNALYFQGDARGTVIDDHRAGLNTGGFANYSLSIGDTSQPVKITLVWSDYPDVPLTSPNLVNDLDLVVTAPDGTIYRGNAFAGMNPGQSIPNPSVNLTDRLNNVENVLVISNVQAGAWTVSVHAFNVPNGPQPFALVMTGGIATNRGQLTLDKGHYKSNAMVHIRVVDTGPNVNPIAPDTLAVNMTSTTSSTPVVTTLTETGNSTSVFEGEIQLVNGSTAPPGQLAVHNGDTIVADYFDLNNGQNQSVHVNATAIVDDTPPVISGVSVTGLRFNRATIGWATDEPASSVLVWDNVTPPSAHTASVATLTKAHSISVKGLLQNTTYYFYVNSTDEAGNTATANNGSAFYHFTTPLMPPTAAPVEEWPTFHNNGPRLGVSPSKFSPPLTQVWTAGPYNVQFWNGPVYADGILFTDPLDGTLRARDPYTGNVLWTRHLGDNNYYTGTMVVQNGVLFGTWYGASGGHVYALDENTGNTIWVDGPSTGLDFNARVAMAADNGLVFGSTWGGQIYALYQSNGTIAWSYQTGESFPFGGPTVAAGLVFQGTTANDLFALDELTGNLVWKAPLDGAITSVPLYAAGVVYVGTNGGTLWALDAFGGSVIWSNSAFGLIDFSTPSYDGTNLYFGSFGNSAFYGVDASTGAIVWTTPVTAPVGTTVAYANGFVYGNAWDGIFRVMNATNGAVVDQYFLNSFASTSAPAVSDGWIWFEDYFGNAYGYFGQLPVGVIASPTSQTKQAVPESQVNYSIVVKNVGVSGPDTFDVTSTAGALGWNVAFFQSDGVTPLPDPDSDGIPDVGPLASNANATIIARVTVPATVNPGDTDTTHITFTSANDVTVSKTVRITTTVPPPGVAVGPRGYFTPLPGQTVNASVTITNTGGFPDTIDVRAVSSEGWTVNLFKSDGVTPLPDTNGDGIPDTGLLRGLTAATIVVRIHVPGTATLDTLDTTTITANSTRSPSTMASNVVVIELVRPPDPEWPTFHNNNARHGESPSIMSPPLTQLWTSGQNVEELWTGPVVDSGMLFSTTLDGAIRARDPFSGDVIWSRTLGGTYYYTDTPTVANGMVFATFDTGSISTVYGLDEMTGATIWSVNGSSPYFNARVAMSYADGMVFGSVWGSPYNANGWIYALNASTGSVVWATPTGQDTPWAGATIAHGLLFMTAFNLLSGAGTMYALNELTGNITWTYALDGTGTSAPLYAQGMVFEGTYAGTMWALDAATGSVAWSNTGVGMIDFSTPSYDGKAIYFGSYGNAAFYALDVGTGAVLWQTSITGPVGSSTAYANGYVYGTAWDGRLRVMYASNGSVADSHNFNILASTSSPAISRGWVWAEDLFGEMYGFGAPGAGVIRAVEVEPSPVSVQVTSAVLLKAMGMDQYGNSIRATGVTWSSVASLGTIVAVSPSGDSAVYVAGTVAGVDTARAKASGFTGDGTVNVMPGSMYRIAVSPTPIEIPAGGTQQFGASSQDRYGNPIPGGTFTWTVVGPIGTIGSSGSFQASTTTGVGVVTATSGTTTGTAVVTVVPGPISSLAVSPTSLSVAAGSMATLSAVAKDSYGNVIPGSQISWSVDLGNVLALNGDGTVALYSAPSLAGTATITATSVASSGITRRVTVSVVAGPVASLTVSPSNPSVIAGGTKAFSVIATDVYGNAVTGLTATWSASLGSVDSNGMYTAPQTTGSAVVTATEANHQAQTTVNVIAGPLDHLALSPSTVSISTGGGASLSAVGEDQYGNAITGLSFTWSTTIGTVQASPSGEQAAFAAGDTGGSGTITVTSGGKPATATVTITESSLSVGRQISQPSSLVLLVLAIVFGALSVILFIRYRQVKKDLDASRKGEPEPEDKGGQT